DGLRELTRSDPALRTEEQLIAGHRVVRVSDASVSGHSREEHFVARFAEVQREYAAAAEAWQVERDAAAQNLAAAQTELALVRGDLASVQQEAALRQTEVAELARELGDARTALQRSASMLEVWRARYEQARQELESQRIELAKEGLRNEDLRLHLGLLESALARPGR